MVWPKEGAGKERITGGGTFIFQYLDTNTKYKDITIMGDEDN